jgi:branched-chain amino acid transport system permease protein
VFLIMAAVLAVRPQGLLGRPELHEERSSAPLHTLTPAGLPLRIIGLLVLALLAALPLFAGSYAVIVASEILIFALFAASLQFLLGVGGMISFGHAAYLGFGAYGAALLVEHLDWPMEGALFMAPLAALLGALVFGWFCVRLSGVYLAMLTLAFAQIAWSVAFQWYAVTGGDNGILGVWPSPWAAEPAVFYWLTLVVVASALLLLRRVAFAPFGYGLRAARDAPLRAEASGIDLRRSRWFGFTLAGGFAGLAGGLYAFLKGSVFPDVMAIPMSVEALVMVLLGGVQQLEGPLLGAAVYTGLKAELLSLTSHWRVLIGLAIVALVLLFPQGLSGRLLGLLRGSQRWKAS